MAARHIYTYTHIRIINRQHPMSSSAQHHAYQELLRAANETGGIASVGYYTSIVNNQERIIVPLHPNNFHLLSAQCLICKKFLNGNSMLRHVVPCQPYPPPAAAQSSDSSSESDEEDPPAPPPDPKMLKKYNRAKNQQKKLHTGSGPFVFPNYEDWIKE